MRPTFPLFWNMVERQREREIYQDIHVRLYLEGYTEQISFYGTLHKPYDDEHIQARIEIVSRLPLETVSVESMRWFLNYYQPDREYTLLVWGENNVKQVLPK